MTKVKARTMFALMFYGVFLYLICVGKPVPEALTAIVTGLFGFYFGSKTQPKKDV